MYTRLILSSYCFEWELHFDFPTSRCQCSIFLRPAEPSSIWYCRLFLELWPVCNLQRACENRRDVLLAEALLILLLLLLLYHGKSAFDTFFVNVPTLLETAVIPEASLVCLSHIRQLCLLFTEKSLIWFRVKFKQFLVKSHPERM